MLFMSSSETKKDEKDNEKEKEKDGKGKGKEKEPKLPMVGPIDVVSSVISPWSLIILMKQLM